MKKDVENWRKSVRSIYWSIGFLQLKIYLLIYKERRWDRKNESKD